MGAAPHRFWAMISGMRVARSAVSQARSALPASRAMSTISIDLQGAFTGHLVDGPDATVETTKEELFEMHKIMYTMRRMEITCDTEYKARNIRGFWYVAPPGPLTPRGVARRRRRCRRHISY